MKKGLRFLIAGLIVLLALFIWDSPIQENEPLLAPETIDPLPANESADVSLGAARPDAGVSMFIGKSVEEWLAQFGEPARIEPSAFEYEWWVYPEPLAEYKMAGVRDGKVVQVYAAGAETNIEPFTIGQTLEELYRFTIVQSEVSVEFDSNVYTFHLATDDLNKRLLVKFNGVYAQLYLDQEDGRLEAARFIDAQTLISHRPYDMIYMGELLPREKPSSRDQQAVDAANTRQLVEIANVYRNHHGQPLLPVLPELHEVAKAHSADMAQNTLGDADSEPMSLAERLEAADIAYDEAAANTAVEYYDAAEAVHGWLNSDKHRSILLAEEFTHTGAGVFNQFYTQEFLRRDAASVLSD
ncbi:CAP domain-containing protein [Planococcus lenghuensis]|uniref:CAP domain-containing protein n=1 Tax=Planococcus lenghuensis TaxID=2213202 RepID=A0A1Q2L043_9BACL|nr:CAP-associated domain-containing protein [Planococcus lenghuensis]AQQ53819.1 hypothetical protein B0X71_12465 [Planococcus lenghuensis]